MHIYIGSPTTVRRVLKPGDNNGKYFFCCTNNTKCDYFLWCLKHPPLQNNGVQSNGGDRIGTLKRDLSCIHVDHNASKKFKPVIVPL
jgi:hypothetical protein